MKYKLETDFTIKTLIELYEKDEVNLNPPYQRNEIWSLKDKKLLINSIERGWPIQNFYLQKKSNGYDMVDGQQRTRAILGYYRNLFPSEQGIFFKDMEDKDIFLNYKLMIIIITNVDKNESIEDFYSRINKTGRKLNRPELKKAEYFDTEFYNLIQKISDLDEFKALNLFSGSVLKRMIDQDFVGELLAQLKSGITEKKLEVDKLFEKDILEDESKSLLDEFQKILLHFKRFNDKIYPINKTRYSQRNDFYTLFGFIKNNPKLKNETFDAVYSILVLIDNDLVPSNEDCEPFYNYTLNCVSQSNSKNARGKREDFLNELFLNTSKEPNITQKAILQFYDLKPPLSRIENYFTLDFKKLKEKIKL
ncbi:DUF262 domain-containing protein [candidate division WOR-3 bacterium]|nr:DUF262 domain-containing protein [candidate division WOR-3 bacterium]